MTLHIFNPEHDLALAFNKVNFTPPHAARQLKSSLGFLPALWAKDGDVVLVENAEAAEKDLAKVEARLGRNNVGWQRKRVRFVEYGALGLLTTNEEIDDIEPWGWNVSIKDSLRNHSRLSTDNPNMPQECVNMRQGCLNSQLDKLLPAQPNLDAIRRLSHRNTAMLILSRIDNAATIGEAYECSSVEEVNNLAARYGRVVLKAPWSGSGRGIRFVDDCLDYHRTGWVKNVIASQGAVMVEPFYNKVVDFGMEFYAHRDGSVKYEGLSLFSTQNGAYTGNILATECAKREIISRYLSLDVLDDIKKQLCHLTADVFAKQYVGPFGVDMMIVAGSSNKGFMLHPCVEINLRRTMGHVALALSPVDDDIKRVMRIDYNKDNYQLIINTL